MTHRSRITKRTAHPIARAGRVATRRERELERRTATTSRTAPTPVPALAPVSGRAAHATSRPVTITTVHRGTATLWDVPRMLDVSSSMTVGSSETVASRSAFCPASRPASHPASHPALRPATQPSPHLRAALTAVPVDWSAVRSSAAS